MTTYGIDRLRRSLDNQRAYGVESYELAMEDMENLVREVEDDRNHWMSESDHWRGECAELMEGPRGPLASDGWADAESVTRYCPVCGAEVAA